MWSHQQNRVESNIKNLASAPAILPKISLGKEAMTGNGR